MIPTIEAILAKKDEGRPITPEEYHMIGSFVDRVERGVIEKRKAVKREWAARLQKAQESVPNAAYDLPLETLGLSDQILQLLTDEEYNNVGDLMLQMEMDSEKINQITGIGPKAMENIGSAIEALTSIMPKDEEPIIDVGEEPEAEIAVEISSDTGEATSEIGISEREEEIDEGADILEELEDIEPQVTEEIPDFSSEDIEKSEVMVDISEEEPQPSLEEIFDIQPELLDIDLIDDDEEDELIDKTRKRPSSKKKKKGQQRKYVDVEYDPDADVTLYHKRRKSDEDDWEDDAWDY